LDGFCSRCHMPANYIDAVKPANVRRDTHNGLEHGLVDPTFDPTSAEDTPFAFASVEGRSKNTEAGKLGLTCSFCHTIAETRQTLLTIIDARQGYVAPHAPGTARANCRPQPRRSSARRTPRARRWGSPWEPAPTGSLRRRCFLPNASGRFLTRGRQGRATRT
jgi:hypothetical protein